MEKKQYYRNSNWWRVLSLSAALLGLGALYYRLVRPPEVRPILTGSGPELSNVWFDISGGALPSFVHALALFLIVGFALRTLASTRTVSLVWICVTTASLVAIELVSTTFSYLDLFAILVAGPIAYAIVLRFKPAKKSNLTRWIPATAMSVFAGLGIATSYDGSLYGNCARYDENGYCIESVQFASPIYMSYEELRSSVRLEGPRPLDDVGRIYAYQNYLFINERNRGVHVIDNTDPFTPIPRSFINIPGNMDVEIRGDRLFADSFIDLVTLDVSNLESVVELDRILDVFPYDAEQAIPYNVRLYEGQIDRDLGVVISYEVDQ